MEKQLESPQNIWINLADRIVEQIENSNDSILLLETNSLFLLKIDRKEVFRYNKEDGSYILNKNEMGVLNQREEENLLKSIKNAITSFTQLENFDYEKEERWVRYLR